MASWLVRSPLDRAVRVGGVDSVNAFPSNKPLLAVTRRYQSTVVIFERLVFS